MQMILFSEYKKIKCYIKTHQGTKGRWNKLLYERLTWNLTQKNGQDFWKVWKSKFHNKNTILHIGRADGVTDSEVIARKFANYFQSNCKPFNSVRSAELKLQYDTVRAQYCGSPVTES